MMTILRRAGAQALAAAALAAALGFGAPFAADHATAQEAEISAAEREAAAAALQRYCQIVLERMTALAGDARAIEEVAALASVWGGLSCATVLGVE